MAKNPRFDDDYWIWPDKNAGIVLDRPPLEGDTDNSPTGAPWIIIFRDHNIPVGSEISVNYVFEPFGGSDEKIVGGGIPNSWRPYAVYTHPVSADWSLAGEWKTLSEVVSATYESWDDIQEMWTYSKESGMEQTWILYRAKHPPQSINKYTIV